MRGTLIFGQYFLILATSPELEPEPEPLGFGRTRLGSYSVGRAVHVSAGKGLP